MSTATGPDAIPAVASAERMKATVAKLAGPEFTGRRIGTPGGAAARAWLTAALRDMGAIVEVDEFAIDWANAIAGNIHARWRDAKLNGIEILLTAHFDGVGDIDGLHRPGASDNAAGVAVVLEAARLLAAILPDGTGLAVALLDGEEIGAVGSARHAAQLVAAGRNPLIINIDGAGQLVEAAAVEAGGPAHPILTALDAAGRVTGVALRGGQVASDNRQYAAAGLAAVGIGAGMPGYHTEHDATEKVESSTLVAIAELVAATVRNLAQPGHDTETPVSDGATQNPARIEDQNTDTRTGNEENEMSTDSNKDLPVVVIGAGPVGLAAAAHLSERGLDFLVLEAGEQVGAAIRQWGHVRVFSPWQFDTDPAARRLLEPSGWTAPDPDSLPTGRELVESYLEPLAALPQISSRLRLGHRVQAVSRVGVDRVRSLGRERAPFLLRVVNAEGTVTDLHARAVIDATGTWSTPNVLGSSGLPAYGEPEAAAWIDHALPDIFGSDRDRFVGKHTFVIGAGHSAANTLLALAELAEQQTGTRISWAIRRGSAARTYGGGDADALPARGALGSRLKGLVESGRIELVNKFTVDSINILDDGGVEVVSIDESGVKQTVMADRIVAATGFRPDHSLTAELRLDLDPILSSTRALAPLIDPNEHSCGTVPPHGFDELSHPETGFYGVGMKSYGRAPTFLMATGYEQVRSVVAAIAGDWDAARDLKLELPETGVCTTTAPSESADAAGNYDTSRGTPEPELISIGVTRGLATGLSGGLLASPFAVATSGSDSGCCGS